MECSQCNYILLREVHHSTHTCKTCLKASRITLLRILKWTSAYKDNVNSAPVGSSLLHLLPQALIFRRCWLCFFFFFWWGVETDRGGRGKQRWKGRGGQTERVYWLVSSSSVDCDKFNCGNPLKADAPPDQPPHHLSLSVSFLCPSAVLSPADLCGQISYVCFVLMDTWGVSFFCMAKLQ